jgi:hypothetical protein
MKLFITPIYLVLGLSLILMPTIASAQYNDNIGSGGDNRDPFNRAGAGDTSGLLQLINQAQLNSQRNPNYSNDQQTQLNSATEDFRARQLQVLRERNKKNSPATIIQPK